MSRGCRELDVENRRGGESRRLGNEAAAGSRRRDDFGLWSPRGRLSLGSVRSFRIIFDPRIADSPHLLMLQR